MLVDGTDVVEDEGRLREWLSEDVKPVVERVLLNRAARGEYRKRATGVTFLERGDISDNPNVLLAVFWLDIDDYSWEFSEASVRFIAGEIRDRLLEEFAQNPVKAVMKVHAAFNWLHSFITDRQQAIFTANPSSTTGDDLDGVRELLVEMCDRALENAIPADDEPNATKEQPWVDDAPEYLPLSLALKLIDNCLSLSTLSKLCKSDGEIRVHAEKRQGLQGAYCGLPAIHAWASERTSLGGRL